MKTRLPSVPDLKSQDFSNGRNSQDLDFQDLNPMRKVNRARTESETETTDHGRMNLVSFLTLQSIPNMMITVPKRASHALVRFEDINPPVSRKSAELRSFEHC
jgi:hypothetical protein